MVFSIPQHSSDISLFNQYNNLDVCMNSLREYLVYYATHITEIPLNEVIYLQLKVFSDSLTCACFLSTSTNTQQLKSNYRLS